MLSPIYNNDKVEDYKIIDYLPILEKNELDYVYRPNDDTYLFLDALKLDLPNVLKSNEEKWILEIGYGMEYT